MRNLLNWTVIGASALIAFAGVGIAISLLIPTPEATGYAIGTPLVSPAHSATAPISFAGDAEFWRDISVASYKTMGNRARNRWATVVIRAHQHSPEACSATASEDPDALARRFRRHLRLLWNIEAFRDGTMSPPISSHSANWYLRNFLDRLCMGGAVKPASR